MPLDKRPEEELYDIKNDPACLINLAKDQAFQKIRNQLKIRLNSYLRKINDPRVTGNGEVFETYPRYEGVSREFPPYSESM